MAPPAMRTNALLAMLKVAKAGTDVISAAQVILGAGPLTTNCVDALVVAVAPEKDTADVWSIAPVVVATAVAAGYVSVLEE